MSLTQKAGKAGSLMLFRKGWGALVNLGVMAYLARTIDKSDFGLVVISSNLINFIQVLAISGIGEYVIYYNGDDRKRVLNAAFWLNFVLVLTVALIVILLSPFWANQFDDPRIKHLIWMLLTGFVFSAMNSIPISIFRKSLDFKPMVTIQTIFGTIGQLTSVVCAYAGLGVYSLVVPNLMVIPVLCIVLFWRSGFRPSLRTLDTKYWKQIFGYTKHMIGATAMNKFANEGDTFIVGKLLGMEALGIYDIAYKLAHILSSHLLPIITTITLPVLSQHQKNLSVVRSHFLKMIQVIALVFFPAFTVMILFANDIILLLYGEKWTAAILPFQILCGFAVWRTISSPSASLYGALGKPHISLYFNLTFTPIFLLAVYFGSLYGLITTCVVVMVLRNAASLFHFYKSNQLTEIRFIEFYYSFSPILYACLFSSGLILLLQLLAIPWPFLVAVFGVSFVLGLRWFNLDFYQNSLILLKSIAPFQLRLKRK
ncbi:MAG: lipopolysaccharide biosynthesis protein [Chitinophagaceae bacterium]